MLKNLWELLKTLLCGNFSHLPFRAFSLLHPKLFIMRSRYYHFYVNFS